MNGTTAQVASGKDQTAWNLLVSYNGVSAPAARYATSLTLCSGEQPSYCWVGWPVRNFPDDERAPNVALQQGGPAGQIKLKTRCRVDYNSSSSRSCQVLAGTLVEMTHDFGEDSTSAFIAGDAFLLQKVTLFGRVTWDPVTNKCWLDMSRPTIFNEGGWPICLDHDFYGPVFAPSYRYGYRNNYDVEDYTEPAVGAAKTRARSFTCGDALQYIRNWCYVAEGENRPPMPANIGNVNLSQWVKWPRSTCDVVGSARVLRNVSVSGMTVARALSTVLRRAGAYDVFFVPSGFSSIIQFINQNPGTGGNAGAQMMLPGYYASDIGSLMSSGLTVRTGYVKESIADYNHTVAIVGDGPSCERMVSMMTDSGELGYGMLEPAWADEDETSLKQWVNDNGNDENAFANATRIWPLVFSAYRVKGNIFRGTKWEDSGQLGPYAKIRPYLLTGSNQGTNNPRDWAPRDIVVEWQQAQSDGTAAASASWYSASRYNNLTVSPDGQYIFLDALRDAAAPVTWSVQSGRGQYEGLFMHKNFIRLTLAATGDQAIVGVANDDPNNTAQRLVDDGDYPWNYVAISDPEDYVDFVRIDGYAAGSQNPKFVDKCQAGDELFTDIGDPNNQYATPTGQRLPRHAGVRLRDVKRVSNPGQLVMCSYDPSLVPGLAVNIVGPNAIPTYSVIKSVSVDPMAQACSVELGNPDSAVIYDMPHVAPAASPLAPPSDYKPTTGQSPNDYNPSVDRTYGPDNKGSYSPNAKDAPPSSEGQKGTRSKEELAELARRRDSQAEMERTHRLMLKLVPDDVSLDDEEPAGKTTGGYSRDEKGDLIPGMGPGKPLEDVPDKYKVKPGKSFGGFSRDEKGKLPDEEGPPRPPMEVPDQYKPRTGKSYGGFSRDEKGNLPDAPSAPPMEVPDKFKPRPVRPYGKFSRDEKGNLE